MIFSPHDSPFILVFTADARFVGGSHPSCFRYVVYHVIGLSPVSIQTQSLALRGLRALRKRKLQETQALALASSQSLLPLFRPSIPIGWRLRLLREIFIFGFRLRNARNASDCV